IHVWGAIFIFARAAVSKWLVVENLIVFSVVTHGLGAVVNIGLNFVLIPYAGGSGAAVSTVVSYATASYLALFLNSRTRVAAGLMTNTFVFGPVRAWRVARSGMGSSLSRG